MNILGFDLHRDAVIAIFTVIALLWCIGAFIIAFRRNDGVSPILKDFAILVIGGMLAELWNVWKGKR